VDRRHDLAPVVGDFAVAFGDAGRTLVIHPLMVGIPSPARQGHVAGGGVMGPPPVRS
jgi:hypothetical protein